MQVRITRSRMAGDPPELLVTPRLADFGLLDFDRAREAIAEGERAVAQALGAAG
jgi:NTE family protein